MMVSKGLVRASRIMAWLSLAAMLIVPLGTMLLFLFPDQLKLAAGEFSVHATYGRLLTDAVPLANRLGAMVFALIPSAIAAWGLWALAHLLRLFARGDVFTPDALRALSRITAALFWNVLTGFLSSAPISWLLTHANPPGHRYLEFGLGSDDVEILFLAGVAFVIARVMAEARRVADENAAFV